MQDLSLDYRASICSSAFNETRLQNIAVVADADDVTDTTPIQSQSHTADGAVQCSLLTEHVYFSVRLYA